MTVRHPGLRGKAAIVIGASRGIGAATARALAQSGARVMITSRDRPALEQLAGALTAAGADVRVHAGDAEQPQTLQAAVAAAVAAFGRLDIAVNNFGISLPATRCADIGEADFNRIVSVNLCSVFAAMKAEIAAMKASGGGAIVNTGSIGSAVGLPMMAAYTASKHGLIGLTKVAAIDHAADGIRVNAVAPGTVMTDMLRAGIARTPEGEERARLASPMKRIADPQEIAAGIVFLCSDAASYITGAVLPIDGGYTAP